MNGIGKLCFVYLELVRDENRRTTSKMFIQDLKADFYNVLRGKRILVIVNYDIDAICASKILQTLFRYDHMVYSIVPIMGIAGLRRAYADNKDDVKNVLLINCGVCIDLVELLQPDEDVTFFVCDSHRPMDVCNVYSDSQVCSFCTFSSCETGKANTDSDFIWIFPTSLD